MDKKSPLLLVAESHPIQYRAPVYARLNQIYPGAIHVVYASDFSLRGGRDPGFGLSVAWDTDLLAGYPSTVLSSRLDRAPTCWNDLDGSGLAGLVKRQRPRAMLLTSLNYRFDHFAYLLARWRRIPIWMRCETQDYAFARAPIKSVLRSTYYRFFYGGINRAFPIGELNQQHFLRHGLKPNQLVNAHYCTPDRAAEFSQEQREQRRQALRLRLGVQPQQLLVAFFGKLIPKKQPDLLLDSLSHLPASIRNRMSLAFIGSGPLQVELQHRAQLLQQQSLVSSIHFPGFINQSALVDWYLAADVVVLPSRRAGETWGLVANEALQAGCGVVVSEAVGCAADFGSWERFRTIPVGSATHLANALEDLSRYPRSFSWASEALQDYSIEAAAQAFAGAIQELS